MKPVWNVYIFNINRQKMEVYNIFDHASFCHNVEATLAFCDTKEDFAEKLNEIPEGNEIELHNLLYYFWAKAEWEIVIKPWVGGREGVENKIDVYSQVKNNWDIFLDYCWSFKNEK